MAHLDWNRGQVSGLVSVGTHRLFVSAAGPPHQPGQPTVIIEAGLGEDSVGWRAVSRHLSQFIRVVTYDRAGLGKSQTSPLPRTAQNIALELSDVLKAADIPPPYVLVGHSYGGILVREFLAANPSQVAGLVFVEANTENSYRIRPEDLVIYLSILGQGLDLNVVTGLNKRHRLLPAEWAAYTAKESKEAKSRRTMAAFAEFADYDRSADILGKKKQLQHGILGNKPVSVIKGEELKDVKLLLDAAIDAGNGTEHERAAIRRWIGMDQQETELQEEHLRLSRNSTFVHARSSGHDVHLTEPEIIADQVRWVLGGIACAY